MSVKLRQYKRGGWEVDIQILKPDGTRYRERRKAPVRSKSGARRWGEDRERHLLCHGPRDRREEAPTLGEFKDRFIQDHCRANKHKPSSIESKEYCYRCFLLPLFARKRLDQFNQGDIAKLKGALTDKSASTTNNVLSTLSMTLVCAAEWGVIEQVPARIKLVKIQKPLPKFYDFDEYAWLLDAAKKIDDRIYIAVLLGGDAGLRRGEIMALEQTDCDLRRGQVRVERSVWNGHTTPTKGMECRVVPMTARLRAALSGHRHLRGDRLLYGEHGQPITSGVIKRWMSRAQRRAGLRATGGVHLLRHTFCSHLAMRGAPAMSIQKLAGHRNLHTTLRYMHLSPGETERAIRLLEGDHAPVLGDIALFGDTLETRSAR